jgi:hypothetical protein
MNSPGGFKAAGAIQLIHVRSTYCPNRCRYSPETMKERTISAAM